MYKNFQKALDNAGITAYKVSKETGISTVTFTNWKKGMYTPKSDKLEKIAKYLGVSVEFLNGNDEKETLLNKIKKGFKIPVIGFVPCGIPIEAIEDIIDYEEIPESMSKNGTYYGLVAKGDSMFPNIIEGDILIVLQTTCIDSGNIAIVKINGDDATCKKVLLDDDGITLMPLNTSYDPIRYSRKEAEKLPITICGKIVEIRRKL